MLGTLHSGDRVIVNKLSYDLHDPRHGDIVVLEDIKASLEVRDLIKRVIALPGETIEYRDCQLFINGQPVDRAVPRSAAGQARTTVAIRRCRWRSSRARLRDGRQPCCIARQPHASIGQIPYDDLIGRAFVIVWPTSDWRWL